MESGLRTESQLPLNLHSFTPKKKIPSPFSGRKILYFFCGVFSFSSFILTQSKACTVKKVDSLERWDGNSHETEIHRND